MQPNSVTLTYVITLEDMEGESLIEPEDDLNCFIAISCEWASTIWEELSR